MDETLYSPVMVCGRFIQNQAVDEDNRFDLYKASRTIEYVATVLDQPARSVWISLFILHVLSFSWGFEMKYAPALLQRGADECAEIRFLVPK